MLEKLFEQFVPSVPSAKNQRVQPEAPYIKGVPPVPPVPSEKTETEIIAELEVETYPRHVTCWTPAGNSMAVLAKDAGHEAFLLMMNPPPLPV
ncbi:hypothetical protein [Methyloglobulus sp.]|uniref:hypothetical protein n=1 Tax=Methyloglobulus sp. TaxID=2518622 RepID=UPI0032B75177